MASRYVMHYVMHCVMHYAMHPAQQAGGLRIDEPQPQPLEQHVAVLPLGQPSGTQRRELVCRELTCITWCIT